MKKLFFLIFSISNFLISQNLPFNQANTSQIYPTWTNYDTQIQVNDVVNLRGGRDGFSNLLLSKTYVYTGHYPVTQEPYYFGSPTAMDVGPDGNLYIASATNRITVFTPEGKFVKAYYLYDEKKPEDKKIHIGAMAVGPSGDIYVLDVLSGLYKFDKYGKKIRLFYYFWGEGCLETDTQGSLYFGVYWWIRARENKPHPNVIKFDQEGNVIKEYYLISNYAVHDLSISQDGKIYVLFNSIISIYDQEGHLIKSKSIDEFPIPASYIKGFSKIDILRGLIFLLSYYIFLDNTGSKAILFKLDNDLNVEEYYEKYYCSNTGCIGSTPSLKIFNSNITLLDASNFKVSFFTLNAQFVKEWQTMGHEAGRFWKPEKIAVDNPGNIYVCDTGNNRVQVFDKKWELKMIIGTEGSGPGQFKNPEAIAVDDEQNIYVVDQGNYRIQKFNKKGEFITMWGSYGGGDNQFENIMDIDVDKDGYVYTLESNFNKVKKFTRDGQFVLKFYMTQPYNPVWGDIWGFTISSDGFIYAVGDHYINIFDTQGNFITYHSKYDYLSFATDIEISPSGDLFISDAVYGLAYFDKNLNFKEYIGNGEDIIKDFPGGGNGIAVHPSGRIYVCSGGDGRIVFYEPRPNLAQTIPAVASKKGANNTYWRTDLSIFNPADKPIDMKLNYFSSFGNKEIDLNLLPYEFLNFKDLISNGFSMPETFGAITSICSNEKQPILFSRTYTESVKGEAWSMNGTNVGAGFSLRSNGTYGQGIRASPYEETFYQGEKAYLIGLKNNQNFRTNIGFFNLKEFPIEINLKLFDEEGKEITSSKYNLDSFGHLQINNIFSSLNITKEYEASYGILWTETQDGRFGCYGSIVDNFTGDPVYIEGEGYGSYLPEEFIEIIPVVASKEGAYGTNWKTQVIITNVGVDEQKIELIYHPSLFSVSSDRDKIIANPPLTKGESKGDFEIPLNLPLKKGEFIERLNLTLQPGEVRYFKDILTEFFSFPESFGWLEIKHSTSWLKVRGRIYTEQQSSRAEEQKVAAGFSLRSNGTYGQEVKAINISKFSKGEGYLIDLEENENYRTNFGLLLLSKSDSNESKKFKLKLIKNKEIIDEKEIEVEEGNLIQINNILSSIFNKTGTGFVLKIIPEEGTIYTSYISKVDNITGDAIFQQINLL